jgi:hypothetical protein
VVDKTCNDANWKMECTFLSKIDTEDIPTPLHFSYLSHHALVTSRDIPAVLLPTYII